MTQITIDDSGWRPRGCVPLRWVAAVVIALGTFVYFGLMISGDSFSLGIQVAQCLMVLLVFAGMIGFSVWVHRRYVGRPVLEWPGWRRWIVELLIAAAVVTAMALFFMGLMWLAPAVGRLGGGGSELSQPVIIAPVVYCVLGFTIAPLAEEMLYRAVLYNSLRRWMRPMLAVIAQAIVFGAMHPYGTAYMTIAFGIGVLLGAMYLWRKTLWSPVLVHGLFNGVSLAPLLIALLASSFTPMLGVVIEDADNGPGCRITGVLVGTAADEALLMNGDIITAVDHQPIDGAGALQAEVKRHDWGDVLTLTVVRDGQPQAVSVRLRGLRRHILW